ncbi:Tetratricopeptide repeat-containing protein [Promicromonospora umidemergens]|uniref:Tetratricopeptide repeat protein n=1 Tax=Promicromonospora umidemergens TaxID=629679 RepID=A0ABP8XC23_9MICO|nr:tetratricopeptide repeat protein [Promicromonospora umidemergens]MCP2281788.1 Tetratricopeptide repeat-containing protein [Promicromonospora umidemergens]
MFGRRRGITGRDSDAAAKKAFERGQREFAVGRWAAAAREFRTAVALAPDSPNSHFLLGASLFNSGDSRGAVEPLRACLAMRPDHADAHFALGVALGRLDQLDDAADHIAKAASLGDRQALDMLPNIGADYCRRCGRAARFGQINNPDADIFVGSIGIGWACTGCRTILCGTCVSGGQAESWVLACPSCGGRLSVLTR